MADHLGQIVGFVSAYLPPAHLSPDTLAPSGSSYRLFVWQVAVHPDFRGGGLATQMLLSLIQRDACRSVNYLETTIGPSNQSSQRLFEGLAQRLNVPCEQSSLFAADLFEDQEHEEEVLFRIGPIDPGAMQSTYSILKGAASL